ncbi:hypothetical protein KEM60_02989 [Austwickia sp. TVS 96-490-7B]|nr:hypothetical protein [Austwickia sp. TVS 96-490-7B]
MVGVVFASDGFESVGGSDSGQVFTASKSHPGQVGVGGVDATVHQADCDA